jgi:arylsulfatase A-like enzyme
MLEFDWVTGEILKTVEKYGLRNNTIIIFSSDNGPVYDDGYDDGSKVFLSTREVDNGHDASGPYSGGKYRIQEGGTRVPFIVSWPGHIKPGISNAMVNQIDFIASFAHFLHIKLAPGEASDSRNFFDVLTGKSSKGALYMVEDAGHYLALRRDESKLVIRKKPPRKKTKEGKERKNKKTEPQLYNLKKDIAEKKNIIRKFPEIADDMNKQIEKIRKASGTRDLK